MTPKYCSHNIHHKLTRVIVKDESIWPFTLKNTTMHNYTHGLSMFDHFGLSTTTLQKEKPFAFVN
jgi:hypothetical protein